MIVAVTIAILLYIVQRAMYGVTVTPDGGFYLAIGRGQHVPRPYSLRMLPKVIKSERVWCYVQVVSYVGSVALASLIAGHLGYGYLAQIGAGLMLAVVPIMRRTVNWPVLLDAPLIVATCLTVYVSFLSPLLALAVIAMSLCIHERAPLLCALCAAAYLPAPLVVAAFALVALCAIITWTQYKECEPHPLEQSVEWLRNPVEAARKQHAPVLYDWRVWLLPWGGLLVGLGGLGVWGWITLAVCYAGCAFTIDRVRIYQMAVLPMTLGLLAMVPEAWVLPLVVLTFYTNTKEI